MRWVKRIVLVLVLILVIGGGAGYFYRNHIIRNVTEAQLNKQLGVPTTLGSANLAPFGGTLSLGNLKIGSPKGYQAPQMFTLGELGLGVNYSELRQDPVRVKSIKIDKPKAVLEMVDGKFNFQALMDQMGGGSGGGASPAPSPNPPQPNPAPADPQREVKLIIDELTISDAEVEVRAPLLPSPVTVKVPSVTLKQIGNADGAQNGAAIKDVIGAAMSALAANAANNPELFKFKDVQKMMAGQAQAVMGKVQKELAQQVEGLTKNLTGDLSKALGGTGIDVGKQLEGVTGGKDPAKGIGDGLGGLLGGDKEKKDKKKDK